MSKINFEELQKRIDEVSHKKTLGKVTKIVGLTIEADGLSVELGELCHIKTKSGLLKAEVVGFRDGTTVLMPLGEMNEIKMGSEVLPTCKQVSIKIGPELIGRVINAFGEPLDEGPELKLPDEVGQWGKTQNPLKRARITDKIDLGIKALDAFTTCGKGQRLGIFSGSGVGKSTLMGMIARNSSADINIIALVGERGREVREFIEESLGEEGLKKSIVIVATSDQANLVRIKAALFAHSIAEYFRDEHGKDVLLMLDSITRVALAQREVGLAIGEPPATRGYTPSVFAMIPKLLERSGTSDKGTITALYTVLVEGDDMNEPISDLVRGVLDGHVVLSRDLAHKNHFPAIDVLGSISRVMPSIVDEEHLNKAAKVRKLLASYREAEDLINIGAYQRGSNPDIDKAVAAKAKIDALLQQGNKDKLNYDELLATMGQI